MVWADDHAAPAENDAQLLVRRIDEYLDAAADKLQLSASVLVKHQGQVLVRRGLGLAERQWEVPNTPDTKFRIGSITKSFTAMLVLQQVDAGKLSLNDSITQYVSHAPEAWKPITVHHLLCHTSGIFNYTDSLEWMAKQALLSQREKLLPIFRDKPLRFPPGEKFEYSNSGYVLLGEILSQVTGENYEALLRKQITKPLKMDDTGYDHPLTVLPRRAAGYSRALGKVQNARYLDMASADAAGAIYSTVEDLAKYDAALAEGKLLSTDSYAKLFTPVLQNYAYGWVVEEQSGYRLIWHTGGINGFSSSLIRRPDTGSCVVVLSNFDDGMADRCARELMALIQGEPYQLPSEHTTVELDPASYDELVGEYTLAPGAVLTVTREGDKLKVQLTGQPKIEVFPEAPDKFYYKVVDAQLSFVRDDAGKVTHLMLHQNGRNLPGQRTPPEEPTRQSTGPQSPGETPAPSPPGEPATTEPGAR